MVRPPVRSRLGRVVARGSVSAMLAVGMVMAVAPAGHAAITELACTGGGQIDIAKAADGSYSWLLSGVGTCTPPNHPAQPRQVTLAGKASTPGLGICSSQALIAPFNLDIAATFVETTATRSVSTVQAQHWAIPASTFPVVSEFLITDASGGALGAGELETHIFLHCPPDGTPVMQVNWVQSG